MMTIAFAVDRGFEKQLGVALASLAASQVDELRVLVLHRALDHETRRRVEGDTGLAVTWAAVSDAEVAGMPLAEHVSAAATFRLLLPEILPADAQRVLYIDADVVVRHPLGPLWCTDLEGRGTGAVRDAGVPWAASPGCLPWRELGIGPRTSYYNSGVLLMDLASWRESGVAERVGELGRAHEFSYADQCALNVALADDILQLDPRWNVQSAHLASEMSSAWLVEDGAALEAALADPAILHFTASPLGRPWAATCSHPHRSEWFEALDRTSWAGWRPSRRRELLDHPGRRVKRRLQVATQALLHGE